MGHLCYLLLVINHQQRHREKDGSEALHGLLKPPSSGQLVALLQASDEIRQTESHGGQPLLCPTVLQECSGCDADLLLSLGSEKLHGEFG